MSETNGYITKDMLLGPERVRYADEDIEGVGHIRIRSLNDREYMKLQSAVMKPDGSIDRTKARTANARWIIACVVDAEGNRLFADGDTQAIQDLDAFKTQRMAEACRLHVEQEVSEGND